MSTVIMLRHRFGYHGLCSINWTVWSSRDMCINWNEP